MKPINILLILSLLLLGSCVDKDLNNDPTKSANLNPNFQLTGIELRQWGSMDIGSICNRYMSPLTQQMQGKTQSRFAPYARQTRQLRHRVLQKRRGKFLFHTHCHSPAL